jgi:plasmid maintenance system antidote protein VapI
MTTLTPPTDADLRAAVARRQIRQYYLAAVVGIHPTRLSAYLHGRAPMPADVALRIARAVEEWPAS